MMRNYGRHSRLPLSALALTYLSIVVLIPLTALSVQSLKGGLPALWLAVTLPEAVAALRLTLEMAIGTALINAVIGSAIAWEMARDNFRGKKIINLLIDLPFAMPSIVVGLLLIALYGSQGIIPLNIVDTRIGIELALLFVTLPFVVRSVEPVLDNLDPDVESAGLLLGASRLTVWRKLVLPALFPAIISGAISAFARAVGEFGAVVLISGNTPFHTEVASVFISSQTAAGNFSGAAALAMVLLLISLAVMLAAGQINRRTEVRHG